MSSSFKRMADIDLNAKRVLIREDLNVPIKEGVVTSAARLEAALPTIQLALDKGAAVIVMSHLGRPTEGEFDDAMSMKPVANWLSNKLGQEVRVEREWQDGVDVDQGAVVLLDNIRFYKGEKADDVSLAKQMAALCDIYIMDAFGTAHRAQASTHQVGIQAKVAAAGPLLAAELDNLGSALNEPNRPMVAVVGGSKVSTKLTVLDSLANVADQLIPGGGIANTFIAAAGFNVGNSLVEMDLIEEAQRLMQDAEKRGGEIPIPTDVVVAKEFSATAEATIKKVDEVADDDMIFDIGPDTAKRYADIVLTAGTILWNGPVGVFEFDAFGEGTRILGESIAQSKAFSIAGGGDTLAAIDKYSLSNDISYISTGGGAFLEFVEGKELPAVSMLKKRAE